MPRIFLINFSSPILISVANNLKTAGCEIVYWQGYRDDWDKLDRKQYPGIIFHHAFDAIKNIPPAGIAVSEFEPISQDLISRLYASGWQALAMMGRADYGHATFTEKRNYYYQYLKFWQGMLKKLNPDAIIFSAIPHSATSHTLYALAKLRGIQTVMINQLAIETRALLMTDYQTDATALRVEAEKLDNTRRDIADFSPDLRKYYLNHFNPAFDPTPQYKTANMKGKIPFAFPRLSTIVRHLWRLTFFRPARFYWEMMTTKRKMNYIGQELSGWQYRAKVREWQKLTNRVRQEYEALQQGPDLNEKFVYLPLNFQPEQTTCPRGDVFDDQLLMIEIVAAALPAGWKLYVKEHAPQWYTHSIEGHQYRYPGYYREIVQFKNTVLIPADISTFNLIARSQAVATVTSTAGWEALLRSKPVLLFGYVWYMYCAGVFRAHDLASCQRALENIKNGYQVEPQKVINFLAALDKVSLRVKNYKTRSFIESDGITFADNVRALTNGIINMINNP